MKNTFKSGFTLLELLIIIIIIGILAAIAIPGFSKAVEKTKVKDAQAVLSAVHSAEKIYYLDQGSFGTLDPDPAQSNTLVTNNYITNPNSGNTTWSFSVPAPTAATFTATATRAAGGGYGGKKIVIDKDFDGTHYNASGSDHPLRDQ